MYSKKENIFLGLKEKTELDDLIESILTINKEPLIYHVLVDAQPLTDKLKALIKDEGLQQRPPIAA